MVHERRSARRSEHARRGGAGFVVGFLTGGVVGLGFGVLFAPKSGAQLRRQIAAQANVLVPREPSAAYVDDTPLIDALDRGETGELAARRGAHRVLPERRPYT